MREEPAQRHHLRLVVPNDRAHVLKMLCACLQRHGHHCDTATIASMPPVHEDVGALIHKLV